MGLPSANIRPLIHATNVSRLVLMALSGSYVACTILFKGVLKMEGVFVALSFVLFRIASVVFRLGCLLFYECLLCL